MFFDSSIPQGYGVGSSGLWLRPFTTNIPKIKLRFLENLTREKLLQLKIIFSQMESFSGKSSGLDPLM